MSEFDDRLKRALRGGADPDPEDAGDALLTVRGMIGETFRYRHRLVVMAGLMKVVLFAVLMGVTGYAAWTADDDRGRLLWGFGFIACALTVGFLGIFHWMLLHRNAVLRELKRLEVAVAALAGGGGGPHGS